MTSAARKLPMLSDSVAARNGELTAILNRDIFDTLPGKVSAKDAPRWEAFRAAYHLAHKQVDPALFPLQVDFELNSTCQMKCSFCVHGQQVVKKNEMNFETFARVIDEGERYGLCSIKLNYINEPLLRKDLPRFVQYARDHGVLNVYFATNGLLLSSEMSERLIDAGLSKIMVSLDAVSPETFLEMRASKELAKIEANILGLLAIRERRGVNYPAVRVNFLRTHRNAHEAEAFIAKWEGVADTVGFQTQVRRPGVDDDLLRIVGDNDTVFRCSFPSKMLVVDSYGQILPCCTFSGRSLPLGNVSETTLAEAWQGKLRTDLKALHAAGDGLTNSVCAHCVGS